MALGLPGIDGALPGGGLARGCLHELCGAPAQGGRWASPRRCSAG